MTFKIHQDLYEDGRVDVVVNSGDNCKITLSPECKEDQWPATTAIHAGKGLRSLFFVTDARGAETRVEGNSPYGNAMYRIKDREKIKALAGNFAIDAGDITKIDYEKNGTDISNVGITFRDPLDQETLQRHNNALILALEGKDVAPRGTAFAIGEAAEKSDLLASLFSPGKIIMNTVGDTEPGELKSFVVKASQNKTGHAFMIKLTSAGSEIVFGSDEHRDGKVLRTVSTGEFAAAQKIAAALELPLTGDQGVTLFGVSTVSKRSAGDIAASMGKMGIINAGAANEIAEAADLRSAQSNARRAPVKRPGAMQ